MSFIGDLSSKTYLTPNITYAGKQPLFSVIGSGGGGGVSDVNNITGPVNIISSDSSISINSMNQDINLSVNFPIVPVQGDITSVNGSITVTTVGDDTNLAVNFPPPVATTTVNGLNGAVILSSPTNTLSFTQLGQTIKIDVNEVAVVDSIKILGGTELAGDVVLQSSGGTVLFSNPSSSIINIESVAVAGVETLNSIAGAVTLTSPNNSVSISTSGQNIQLQTVSGGPSNTLSGTSCSVTALQPQFNLSPATISLNADGGSGGSISLIAQSGGIGQSGGAIAVHSQGGNGIGGLYGAVRITADAGHDAITQITTGGVVEITANTGLAIGSLCSIVRTNAASIQSFAGAISVIPSANPGFQTIYGNQGISIIAGLPGILPQVPFTTYMYAPAGISLDSTVFTNTIRPYWPGVGAVPDLAITGRSLPSSSYVVLEDVKSIDMASSGTITGVVSINGASYPPSSSVAVNSLNGLSGAVTLSAGTNITLTPTGNDIAISATNAPAPVLQATYYKTTQQNLVNGDTDISFDAVAAWNNDAGYINHVPGSIDFSVVGAGLYSLEFNISINANGATWNNSVNKSVSIDITRIGIPEVAVIQDSGMKQTGLSYQQTVASSYYLQVGDIINLRNTLAYASATPFAVGLQNTFDLNTFFSWRYITA